MQPMNETAYPSQKEQRNILIHGSSGQYQSFLIKVDSDMAYFLKCLPIQNSIAVSYNIHKDSIRKVLFYINRCTKIV